MRHRLVLLVASLAVLVLALDYWTKERVLATLEPGERIDLLGSLLGLELVFNPGAALSIAEGMTWVLTIVAVGVVAVVVRVARHLGSRLWAVAFGLLSFQGFMEAPRGTLLWVRTREGLEMTTADGDDQPGADLQRVVARHFIIFFDEMRTLVPELAALPFHLKEGN